MDETGYKDDDMSNDLKPCPFCGGEALIGDCMDAFWAWCPTCDVTHETESAAINAWNRRADSLALTAAVQAEREACAVIADESWDGEGIADDIRSRGPAPAVDVMAVVREYVEAKDALQLCDRETVARANAAESALRALVSPTTGEGKP